MTNLPILRTSERRAFKRCQARWWWSYREGLKPKGAASTPLWFGTGVHIAFAEWYIPGVKRGRHPAETFEEFAIEALREIKGAGAAEERVAEYEEGLALGIVLMNQYVEYWGQDGSWDFIQPEQTFSLDVPWPAERQTAYVVDAESGVMVKYNGTYDGVYRDLVDGRIKLLETKTAKAVSTGHLTLDDQAGSYWAVASFTLRKLGLIGPKESISGINYNFVRKSYPDERPKDPEGYATNKPVKADYLAALGDLLPDAKLASKAKLDDLEATAKLYNRIVLGERSKVQPPALFERHLIHRTGPERQSQLRRIQDEAIQMRSIKDGLLPITKNPTRDCGWDCEFFAMCELQERQGNWQYHRDAFFKVQDPYADHRKSAEE
jgi:hypothetical protein